MIVVCVMMMMMMSRCDRFFQVPRIPHGKCVCFCSKRSPKNCPSFLTPCAIEQSHVTLSQTNNTQQHNTVVSMEVLGLVIFHAIDSCRCLCSRFSRQLPVFCAHGSHLRTSVHHRELLSECGQAVSPVRLAQVHSGSSLRASCSALTHSKHEDTRHA